MTKNGPFLVFQNSSRTYFYNFTRNTLCENFKSNGKELQSLGGKMCWKMVKHWLRLAQTWHKKDLSYEFDLCMCVCVCVACVCCVCVWVCVVGHLQKQQIDPGILTGCDEACMGMFKVLLNDELAISQEWVEVWKFLNVVGYIINLFRHFSYVWSSMPRVAQSTSKW